MNPILTDLDKPLVFRTASESVCRSSLEAGSIWLRSDQYYRKIEDRDRSDALEGSCNAKHLLPLHFPPMHGPRLIVSGGGHIGQTIVPHYLASFHSTSITAEQRQAFGGHTFGVRDFAKLAAEVLFRCSHLLPVTRYRYGPVSYQHSALVRSADGHGAAIELTGNPSTYVKVLDTDVLRKRPEKPFTDQDEWRIAIFTSGYLNNDPNEPLRVHVDPSHFYPYLGPELPAQPE